jgi:hypothetical protein
MSSDRKLAQQGFDALRRQDFAGARRLLAELAAAGGADADDQLGLALASARLGDAAGAELALQAALSLQPRHLRALLLRADLLVQRGEIRQAAAAYQRVLKAWPDPQQLVPAQQRDWQRASDSAAALAEQLGAQLAQGLQAALDSARHQHGDAATARFARAVDTLLGRRRLYRSQPRLLHYPELPDVECFDPADFDWIPSLEAQTAVIRDELRGLLLQRDARFRPYVESGPGQRALRDDPLTDNPDWSACYLWRDGVPVRELQAACPRTMAALAAVPLAQVPGRSPNVLFSLLAPGVHIPPHHGFLNTRCIVHLPLIVPAAEPPCRLRVGNTVHAWQEGRALVFDDSIEHEAWNPSGALRVVLLFEVWRPELSALERELLLSLFAQIGPPQAGEAL